MKVDIEKEKLTRDQMLTTLKQTNNLAPLLSDLIDMLEAYDLRFESAAKWIILRSGKVLREDKAGNLIAPIFEE